MKIPCLILPPPAAAREKLYASGTRRITGCTKKQQFR
jgi:hypothetical protein